MAQEWFEDAVVHEVFVRSCANGSSDLAPYVGKTPGDLWIGDAVGQLADGRWTLNLPRHGEDWSRIA